jgi:tight adherence protein C
MFVPISLGALAGLGLWCLLRAFLRPTAPLDQALAALSKPSRGAGPGRADFDGYAHRVGAWIMSVTGSNLRSFAADLAVLERSEEVHLVQRMRTGAFYALLPWLVWLPTALAGALIVHPALIGLVSVAAAVVGWFTTDSQVRHRATRRRAEFDAALVTYVSLVSILLAGGAGIQQSLHDAVEQGRGWPFMVLRRSLTDARIRGLSPWESLNEHGAALGLDTLVDLAATMELAGTSGAHVRESLMTKAQAIRAHQVADIEREASGRTTAMAGPTGLMMIGFVVLIIYPAFQAILDI